MEKILGEKVRSNPVLESKSGIRGEERKEELKRKHFVLVHGACHGAWCWYKLVSLLQSAGHKVTALDLAASGNDPREVDDIKWILDYFQPLIEFMKDNIHDKEEEEVILVGHSMGGLAISKVMESYPEKISVAVFLTASMPGPTNSASTISQEVRRTQGSSGDSIFGYDDGPDKPPTTVKYGPIFMSTDIYEFSSLEDLNLAIKLVRPVRLFSEEDIGRSIVLSQERFGSVRRIYIISNDDKVITKDFAEWMVEKTPPHEVKIINESDHMVMFSATQQLFDCLQEIASETGA